MSEVSWDEAVQAGKGLVAEHKALERQLCDALAEMADGLRGELECYADEERPEDLGVAVVCLEQAVQSFARHIGYAELESRA